MPLLNPNWRQTEKKPPESVEGTEQKASTYNSSNRMGALTREEEGAFPRHS